MFQWLKNLFRGAERYDTYRPSEKLIFNFHNGKKWVKADPQAVFCRLKEVWGDLSVDMKVARSPMAEATEAHRLAMTKIRNIFNLPPLQEGLFADETLTDFQATELLDSFMTFVGALKKNSSQTPTNAKETSPSMPSTSSESPPTQSIADSGSTENDSKTDKLMPSVSGSESAWGQSAPD